MTIRSISSLVFVCATFAFGGIGSAQRDDTVSLFGPTGSPLLEDCSAEQPEVGDVVPVEKLIKGAGNSGICIGYIAGINDSQMMQVASGKPRSYCLPSGVQIDQLRRVLRKYLEDNPANLHMPGGILVKRALEQAFPCR